MKKKKKKRKYLTYNIPLKKKHSFYKQPIEDKKLYLFTVCVFCKQ